MFGSIQLCLLLLLTCHLNLFAQKDDGKDECSLKLENAYYSDGQDHQLVILSYRYTRLNIIFLPQFTYQLVICGIDHEKPIRMNLKDDLGNILYSTNHADRWNFQFDALLKGTLELKLTNEDINNESIRVIIGYKPK